MKGFKRKREKQGKDQKKSKKRTSATKDRNVEEIPQPTEDVQNELVISAFSDEEDSDELRVEESNGEESAGEELENEENPSDVSDEDIECSDKPLEGKEDDDIEEGRDPFTKHFKHSLHPELLKILESPSNVKQENEVWPILRNIIISVPKYEAKGLPVSKILADDEITYAEAGASPKVSNLSELTPKDLYIRSQLGKNCKGANCALNDNSDETKFLTEFQNELFTVMNNYQDLYFSKQTLSNTDSIRFVYVLHMVNHVLKTRTRVLRHNAKLKNKPDDDVPVEFRDQGFVRPKVLVLLPFKSSAFKVISLLEKLLFPEGKKGSVMNKKRFLEEYKGDTQHIPFRKPEEYKKIFAGNTQDDFTMGISVTRKALKLYSEFYSSDIIVSSPLSLRRIIGAKGDKDRDYDFLSSIELLIMDQTDIFMMQNWHHILDIFKHLHLKLKQYRRTDFSRIRHWNVDGHAKFYRQTLIFTSVNLPLFISLFNRECQNYAGKVVVLKNFKTGAITNELGRRQHDFYRFKVDQSAATLQRRFENFMKEIFPLFQDGKRQVLIYIPIYYDFVKLRNHFMKQCINFMQICEHSPPNKVAEARDLFFNQDVHFLLYTERYHFYNRITLKGIRHIVFYDLPSYPHYYSELCNMMNNANLQKAKRKDDNFTVSVLYSHSDYYKLVPIVGTAEAKKMISSDREVHSFINAPE